MEFMLASVRDAHAEIMRRNLQSTIGQKVYEVHDSLLFAADITLKTCWTSVSRKPTRDLMT
jgi:hypothetical protein